MRTNGAARFLAALCLSALCVLAVGGTLLSRAAQSAEGRFGNGLIAGQGAAQVTANAAYSSYPLTCECWVKLDGKQQYNIIVANEDKPSATHWEIFTTPQNGVCQAYLPGRKPDHVNSQTDIVDGKWHCLALVLEADRVRLYVDGVEKANVAASAPKIPGKPGPLAIGALVTGDLTCTGVVDEVRLSNCARSITGVPAGEFAADANTIGLWHFNSSAAGKYEDRSRLNNAAQFKKNTTNVVVGQQKIAGGMPTDFQPLPPAEDVAPLRSALQETVALLKLSSIAVDQIRDAVLREWSYDFNWYGKVEYPQHRGTSADKKAIEEQAYDRHALVWPADGGPAGTVLRRTGALLENLEKAGHASALVGGTLSPAARDFNALKAAFETNKPDAGSAAYKGYYLAACALRRQIALANPLLDFDTILCVARGTFAGSVRSNPETQDYQGGHFTTQYFGFNALPGGGLYLVKNYKTSPEIANVLRDSVVQNGRLSGKKLDYGAFATPDLSYDGRTIVFAWTENSQHRWTYSKKTCWHIFRVGVDGSNLTQLTDGEYDDFDPCFLPDGRVAFISERRAGYIRCFAAYLKVRNYTLFSMKDDGSDIVPLSYYETNEWNPSVNNDGKLVYTRWDYTDRENCLGTRFWISGPDGADPRSPHGNYPLPYHTFPDHTPWKGVIGRESDSRMGTPLVEMGIRAIPGSHKYICTGAPHHGEVYGSLCMLDLRIEDDNHMSQVRRITPDEPFPETETPGRRHYKYGTPWPLSEDFFLCNVWENMVLLDRYGNKEVLCDLRSLPCKPDERLRIIDPIPVRPRPRPPARAGARSSLREGAAGAPPVATVAVMNVYDSDLPFPKDTKIKWLRVVQNILKENHAMGEPMIGYERENTPRIPLGIVPVEEDGSVHFEAPVAKELILQVLDENYMAVQSMRSVAFVHPGEQLTCIGCHEKTHKAPALPQAPLALRRAPSKLRPELGPVEPISYYRQIKPLLERKCVACHVEKNKEPTKMTYEALKDYTFWFSGAMWRDMCSPYSGIHGGSRTIPGRFGARNCRLGKALFDANHIKDVSAEDRHTLIVWLDTNSLRLTSYIREAAQLKGELVWPTVDVDPANVLGIEGAGPPLKKMFWHENTYGPHAFLGASHLLKKIYILDEKGEMVWDYEAPNPQDVWMLPNGNVLTTHLRGVQEVTREKQVVWEYNVAAPDEVPTCQPLPDGNVLIGIVGQCRLLEVNRNGEVVHEVKLETTVKEPHAQFRMCRKTPEGTYLVPFTAEGAAREIGRDGKVLREFPRRPFPVSMLRLENGNTLIGADRSVTEYDTGNRIVWELTENDVADIALAVVAGIQRLPNGNTIVCNWNAKDEGDKAGAHIFEVTHDKRIVWQVTGGKIGQVAQCQLLNADLTPKNDQTQR